MGIRAKSNESGSPRTVLAAPVYEALKEWIMDQGLAPGSRLNIDSLAERLGTSPTPVREALTRLAAERLVQFVPFKGYSVMPLLDQRQLADLMHVRSLLEVDAARLAASRIILADLRVMEREQDAMAAEHPEPVFDAYRAYNQHDLVFHETMIAATGNTVLLETYRTLQVHTLLARLYHDRGEVDYQESVKEHRAIIEALRNRDAEAAGEAVRRHIRGVEQRLGAILELQLERTDGDSGPRRHARG
ncbi:MAG: GntR family transcriptional regulator [Thermomicrobiales bacterium]|nr:GntR family transcriptional regulator [Thermomicrobiales bacterium]